MSATGYEFGVDSFGWVTARAKNGGLLKSQGVEAMLLLEILLFLARRDEPLAEAVEWERLDGTERTTDKAMARNWATAVGVRVVRRATATVDANEGTQS